MARRRDFGKQAVAFIALAPIAFLVAGTLALWSLAKWLFSSIYRFSRVLIPALIEFVLVPWVYKSLAVIATAVALGVNSRTDAYALPVAACLALGLFFPHKIAETFALLQVFWVNFSSSTDVGPEAAPNSRQAVLIRVRPEPQPYGVSPKGAERLVAEWLVYLGHQEVSVTSFTRDGGVDVESMHLICQVKNYGSGPVTASEIRDLFGTATSFNKQPVIFTSSRLTPDALEFANKNEIAAVRFMAEEAQLESLNASGSQFLEKGSFET